MNFESYWRIFLESERQKGPGFVQKLAAVPVIDATPRRAAVVSQGTQQASSLKVKYTSLGGSSMRKTTP